MGYSLWAHKESDTTERLTLSSKLFHLKKGKKEGHCEEKIFPEHSKAAWVNILFSILK